MEAEVCKISILRRGEVCRCAVLRACSGTRGGGEDTCFNTQGSLTGIISWSFKILCFIKQFSLDPFYAHLVNSSQLCMQFKLLSWNFYIETYIIWVKFWYMNGHLEIVLCVNQHLNASFNNLCTTTSSIVQINRISPMIMTCFLYIHHPPQLAIVYRKYIIANGWWSKLLLHSHWNGHQEDGWVLYNVIGMGSWDGTVSLDPCPSIMRVTGKYWPFKLWSRPRLRLAGILSPSWESGRSGQRRYWSGVLNKNYPQQSWWPLAQCQGLPSTIHVSNDRLCWTIIGAFC